VHQSTGPSTGAWDRHQPSHPVLFGTSGTAIPTWRLLLMLKSKRAPPNFGGSTIVFEGPMAKSTRSRAVAASIPRVRSHTMISMIH